MPRVLEVAREDREGMATAREAVNGERTEDGNRDGGSQGIGAGLVKAFLELEGARRAALSGAPAGAAASAQGQEGPRRSGYALRRDYGTCGVH
jgi:hypothetical protein